MEGLIKIRVEGNERQPVATCDLDEAIESKGSDLGSTITGWVTQYMTKNNIPNASYEIEREGNNFRFKIF